MAAARARMSSGGSPALSSRAARNGLTVFHSRHDEHLPIHCTCSVPHSLQKNTSLFPLDPNVFVPRSAEEEEGDDDDDDGAAERKPCGPTKEFISAVVVGGWHSTAHKITGRTQ